MLSVLGVRRHVALFFSEAAHEVAEVAHVFGSAGHLFHHVFHFVGGGHHFAHLAELFEQGVDFLQASARAFGDAGAAGAADDLGAAAFVLRHAEDDGLGALHFFVVEGIGGELFFDFSKAGEQPKQPFERAEVLDHFHLIEEVGEVEFSFGHALGGAHGVGFVDLVGDLLDHADDVAHAEDTVSHAGGVEFAELVDFFAFANVFDGFAGDGTHGEGGTTAGIAVELGEDDASEPHGVVEVGGYGDGLLTSGGIGDE